MLSGGGRLRLVLLAALVLSGFAALVYEVVWVRRLGELFGHTAYAIQVVLAVFFGGVAAGSALSDRWRPSASRRLLYVYALLELGIGAAGLALPDVVRRVTPLYDQLAPMSPDTGPALSLRLAFATGLLLLPTAMMGASFPLAVRWLAALRGETAVAAPYAVNTAGGACGAWACAFLLIPSLGIRGTVRLAAVANALAAALAVVAAALAAAAPRRAPSPASAPPVPRPLVRTGSAVPWPLLLLATGLVAVGLEVLWVRGLEQVLSGSVYSFATVLSVFLLGIAAGAPVYTMVRRRMSPLALWVSVELVLGWLVMVSVLVLARVPELAEGLARTVGPGLFQRGIVLESLLSLLVLFLPALCMGLVFPLSLEASESDGGGHVGTLVAANTLGSVAAPLLVGLVILPRLGLARGLAFLAWLTIGLAICVWVLAFGRGQWKRAAAVLALSMAALTFTARHDLYRPKSWEQVVDRLEDPAASVAVVAQEAGQRLVLKVNNTYVLGGGLGLTSERRQGHLAMLWHPRPDRVLVLGVGTGDTLGAVALHRPAELNAVELVEGVLEMARRHFADSNQGVFERPGVRVLHGDALRAVRLMPGRFDVVLGDLFHPWQAGVGSLYSREHFDAVRRALAPHGLFCQWLPLYQLSAADLRTIVRTFLRVFPSAQAWIGNFGTAIPTLALVGSDEPPCFVWDRWSAALADPDLRRSLESASLAQAAEAYGGYVAGRPALEAWTGDGPSNTSDRPLVEFGAPLTLFTGGFGLGNLATLVDLDPSALAPVCSDGRAPETSTAVRQANTEAVRNMIRARLALERRDAAGGLALARAATRRAQGYDAPAVLLAQLAWQMRALFPEEAAEALREAQRTHPARLPAGPVGSAPR